MNLVKAIFAATSFFSSFVNAENVIKLRVTL